MAVFIVIFLNIITIVINLFSILGENYGCEVDTTSGNEVCGFGKGEIQNEYYACADIAIFSAEKVAQLKGADNVPTPPEQYVEGPNSNTTHHTIKRAKRAQPSIRVVGNGRNAVYLPFPQGIDIQFHPLSGGHIMTRLPWETPSGRRGVPGRMRRRVHMPEQHQSENFMMNGMMPARPRRRQDRQVRINFNLRRGQGLMFPMEEMQPPPEPSMVRVEEPTISAVPQHPLSNLMNAQQQNMNPFAQFDRRLQRNFIDPLNPDFGAEMPTIHKVTQTLLSRQYAPTKQCQYCPFDQCLDDQLRIDSLFPGLFDEPRTFLECRKYEKLFNVGSYDIVQEGLPDCTHPRFKRQLMGRMQDEDIGCCST